MRHFSEQSKLITLLDTMRDGKVGFVPTMGALHEGHLSLVKRAREECKTVVVSIFVNPTQFNDKADLKSYPRMETEDLALLEEAGVDIVFLPTVSEIYPEPDTRQFDFGALDKVMEGASRPGHFNGVAQVVSRLFDIVKPDRAYFGEKDFQQIAIIKDMVRQLGFGVEIVDCPIKRADNGLALSSRNMLLDDEHRAIAPHIYRTLKEASKMTTTHTPKQLEQWVTEQIDATGSLKTVYFNIVDSNTLQEITTWTESDAPHGCITVQAGSVRLIDNISFICK